MKGKRNFFINFLEQKLERVSVLILVGIDESSKIM